MLKFIEEAGSGPKAWLYALIAAAAVVAVTLLWWILSERKRKEKRWTRLDEEELERRLMEEVSVYRD